MTDHPIPADKLQSILDGAAKATPGPWERRGASVQSVATGYIMETSGTSPHVGNLSSPRGSDQRDNDAAFIAACDPQTITSLILELQSFRTERDTINASNTTLAALLATSIEDRNAINARLKEVEGIADRITERIDSAPSDGINAEGRYNLSVAHQQAAFIDGMRSARLIVLSALARAEAAERELALVSGARLKEVESARIILTSQDEGVLVERGGKFDGWLMRRHPDGQWVSVRKLDAADPFDNPVTRMLAGGSS